MPAGEIYGPIEAPCPALAALKRDRESSKCKEVIPFYCSSLANPAAPKAGSPLRYDKLQGLRSLEHFQPGSSQEFPQEYSERHRPQGKATPQRAIRAILWQCPF